MHYFFVFHLVLSKLHLFYKFKLSVLFLKFIQSHQCRKEQWNFTTIWTYFSTLDLNMFGLSFIRIWKRFTWHRLHGCMQTGEQGKVPFLLMRPKKLHSSKNLARRPVVICMHSTGNSKETMRPFLKVFGSPPHDLLLLLHQCDLLVGEESHHLSLTTGSCNLLDVLQSCPVVSTIFFLIF